MAFLTKKVILLHDTKAQKGSNKNYNDSNDLRQNLEAFNGGFDLENIDPSMKPML